MRKLFAALLALALLFGMTAFAVIPSPNDDFYYYDSANVLTDTTEGLVYFNGSALGDACGSQIVVVTVPTIGSAMIDNYAANLFNQWGIGDPKKDNGFLLLMSIEDDDYYVMAGSGAERVISYPEISELLDLYLEPYFAIGDYDIGVQAFFEQMFYAVRDFYGVNLAFLDAEAVETKIAGMTTTTGTGWVPQSSPAPDNGGSGIMGWIIIILIIVLIVSIARRGRRRTGGYTTVVTTAPRRRIIFAPRIRAPRVPRPPRVTPPRSTGFGGVSRSAGSRSSFSSSRPSRPSRPSSFGGGCGFGGGTRGGGVGRHR